jgi:sec-independent protein translocase protein TatC
LVVVSAIRTIGHEDRLSLVDHLDELRVRLIVCAVALAVAFGVCLWQNQALLHIINKPLKTQTSRQVSKGEGTVGQAVVAQKAIVRVAKTTSAALAILAAQGSGLTPSARQALVPLQSRLGADIAAIPREPPGDLPVTLGVGEPFTTTITVAFYFALIFALPIVLFELYGFIMPALHPRERRAVAPLLLAVPFLFVAGVAFGYFVVLPAATRFFVNFNAGEFNVLVQASQYYSFAATILLAMGIVFQTPVVILALTRAGIVTPRQLRRSRRYALVACAAVAAFLPGDAITLLLETVPLYLLFEASILLAALFAPAQVGVAEAGEAQFAAAAGPEGAAPAGSEPSVQEMIDHVDPEL